MQTDFVIFDQSYIVNCSFINSQNTFLEELSNYHHIDYFQSVNRFLESGLSSQLSVCHQNELNHDKHLCELQKKLKLLVHKKTTETDISKTRHCLTNYCWKLNYHAHCAYQKQWVHQQRNWKILTDKKKQAWNRSSRYIDQHEQSGMHLQRSKSVEEGRRARHASFGDKKKQAWTRSSRYIDQHG